MCLKLLTILVISFVLVYGCAIDREARETEHNAKIDFSCVVDEDCVIKDVGCDICYGSKRACVNKDSVEGICLRKEGKFTCLAESEKPNWCVCENNTCTSVFKIEKLLEKRPGLGYYELCDEITRDSEKGQVYERNYCYFDLAILTRNLDTCLEVSDEWKRRICTAIINNDPNLCPIDTCRNRVMKLRRTDYYD